MAAETAAHFSEPAAPALASTDHEDPPLASQPEHPLRSSRAHLEDDFFARGDEIASVPPSFVDALEESEEVVRRTVPPEVLARRARMRRAVGIALASAAALTVLAGARAWWTRSPAAPAPDSALSVRNVVVPSIAMTAQEMASAPAELAPTATAESIPSSTEPSASEGIRSRHLPIVDIELPVARDVATERAWETAAERLAARDFSAADQAFAELGRQSDLATRETARLARAMWWMLHGKQAEVRPVLADLAANATTPYVQQHARELLRAN